jgi:hypothetical protein
VSRVSNLASKPFSCHVRNLHVFMVLMQLWKAVVLDFHPDQGLPLDLLSIPAWVLVSMLESGQSPTMKDRSGYCTLFEDLLTG